MFPDPACNKPKPIPAPSPITDSFLAIKSLNFNDVIESLEPNYTKPNPRQAPWMTYSFGAA